MVEAQTSVDVARYTYKVIRAVCTAAKIALSIIRDHVTLRKLLR
jgi:hypothetical protein